MTAKPILVTPCLFSVVLFLRTEPKILKFIFHWRDFGRYYIKRVLVPYDSSVTLGEEDQWGSSLVIMNLTFYWGALDREGRKLFCISKADVEISVFAGWIKERVSFHYTLSTLLNRVFWCVYIILVIHKFIPARLSLILYFCWKEKGQH